MNLNQFLESRGITLKPRGHEHHDGYMSPSQKKQFIKQLGRYPHVRTIAEIGFNGGHSAETFFKQCKNLQLFVAFDINFYPCTKHTVEYFTQRYKSRFTFIEGDSLIKVPEFHQKFPHMKFDLIYVDGCHRFEWALGDITHAKKIAHENTILWVDDVHYSSVYQNEVGGAVKFLETLGIIRVKKRFTSNDPVFGVRSWLQAKVIL